jgi:HAE1 family hydrophobic/amphiphilic exporter-1
MALTLSVGFVVDDAIVMLENIVRYMEAGKGRYEAAILASKEIGFTIVSMTVSLVAVFIPVLFMRGMVGRVLHEFSITIIVAILISGFVSLTFTPMLGSRFLPPHNRRHGRLYHALERGFEALAAGYDYTLRKTLHHSATTMAVAAATLAGTLYMFMTMPTGFIPSQDQGFLFGVTMAGQDVSFDSMAAKQKAIADITQANPNVESTITFAAQSNSAFLFSKLRPRDQRELSADETITALRPQLAKVPGIMAFLQNPPPITINGQFTTSIYQMTVQSVN